MPAWTQAERRGALLVALLLSLGAARDLWRAAHPRMTPHRRPPRPAPARIRGPEVVAGAGEPTPAPGAAPAPWTSTGGARRVGRPAGHRAGAGRAHPPAPQGPRPVPGARGPARRARHRAPSPRAAPPADPGRPRRGPRRPARPLRALHPARPARRSARRFRFRSGGGPADNPAGSRTPKCIVRRPFAPRVRPPGRTLLPIAGSGAARLHPAEAGRASRGRTIAGDEIGAGRHRTAASRSPADRRERARQGLAPAEERGREPDREPRQDRCAQRGRPARVPVAALQHPAIDLKGFEPDPTLTRLIPGGRRQPLHGAPGHAQRAAAGGRHGRTRRTSSPSTTSSSSPATRSSPGRDGARPEEGPRPRLRLGRHDGRP